MKQLDERIALWAAVVLGSSALAIALSGQHLLGMQPCAWCVLQRTILLGVVLLSLMAIGFSGLLRVSVALASSAACVGGLAAATYQYFVAANTTDCTFSHATQLLEDSGLTRLWPAFFEPRASCAEASATLLGVPMELLSFGIFLTCSTLLSLAILGTLRNR